MSGLPPKRQPGEVVNGRFLIERELGSGAMGEVFLAHDGILDRDVAMKYLKCPPDKSAMIAQFKSEFATLTHLSHPHVTKVFDFAQDETTQQYFFTSEFINGRDFFTVTAALSPKQIEALFVQALRALEYLHGNNIFHFDIKPQNLLVTGAADNARVQLIDFGLASLGGENKLIGTPSYMPPEIIARATPNGRADLYSLGVLMYYALTRTNPFRGSSREETFSRHLHHTPLPPSGANPKVPAYLDDIILRLLAKRPDDRYANAAQVIQDLNLRCGNAYPVETPETLLAYIPWEGKFIGRTKALAEVNDLLRACRDGARDRPPVVWIRGARGTGKSRLLREIKFSAQLAGHPTHRFDRADITSRVAWLAAIDSALEDPAQPVIFFMDDIHTLITERVATELVDGLRQLIGQIRSQLQLGAAGQAVRALVIISSPDDAATGAAVRAALRLPPHTARSVAVANFTAEELQQYLATLTGLADSPATLVQQLHAYTEGNPLFVTEVVKQLIAQGLLIDATGRWKATTFDDLGCDFARLQVPPTVEAIVAQEYARLTQPEQAIAAALAVWGKPATMTQLANLMSAEPAKEHLAALTQKGLLSYDPLTRAYQFRNLTKQRAIYQQIGADERSALHTRAADLVANDPTATVDEGYYHRGATGDPATAAPALWDLAQHQLDVHRPHDAIATLQQLTRSQIEPSIEARLLLARAHREAREYPAAQKIYEDLIRDLAGQTHEQARCAHIYEELGRVLMKTQDYLAAETAFMQALSIITHTTHDRTHQLSIENYIGQTQLYRGAVNEAITTFRRTLADAAALPMAEQQQITNNDLGMAYFEQGAYPAAIAQLTDDVTLHAAAGNTQREMRAHYYLASAHMQQQHMAEAREEYERVLALAKHNHDTEYLVNAYTGLANVAKREGEWATALSHYERALDLSGRLGDDTRTSGIAISLGQLCRQQGQEQRAEGSLLSALAFLENAHQGGELHARYHCEAHLELGELYRIQKQFARAGHHLDEAWQLAAKHRNCTPLQFWIAMTRVELLRDQGDNTTAKQTLRDLRTLATDDTMRHHVDETEKSLVE